MGATVTKVLKELEIMGFSFSVGSDGETDYEGKDVAKVMKAANELDEAVIRIIYRGEAKDFILYIPSLDEDEQMADMCSDGPVQVVLDTYYFE